MRHTYWIGLLSVLLLCLWGTTVCAAVKEINAQELKSMMDKDQITVVFPLSAIEFNDIHIPGSINIDIDELSQKLPPSKATKLAFYCLGRQWTAAPEAAGQAAELGYNNVFVFRDGLPGWIAAGYPTVSVEKLPKFEAPTLSTAELNTKLDAKEDLVLLDIRIPNEAKKFWIKNTNRMWIPLSDLPTRYKEIPPGKKVVVIDLNGKRSPIALRYLNGKGYQDLAKISGGMHQWVKDGFPTEYGK
jgi:rhodanese-related sulfurtransferase